MSDIPFVWVKDRQQAQDVYPDQPVVLVWVHSTGNRYMRYHGELYKLDRGSYSRRGRWRIDGVGFNNDSIYWMIDNSIAFPFSQEDLVLYQLTWGDIRD